MLYLEDYLEMIENLPMEMRDRFTEMREMDLQVQNGMDNLEEQVKVLFKKCCAPNVDEGWKKDQFQKIKEGYYKALDHADEKVQLANEIYSMVDKHLRKLDVELQKFKMELEADNAGITEKLEKRSLELDAPLPMPQSSRMKERRHLHTTISHSEKIHKDRMLSSIATEAVREVFSSRPSQPGFSAAMSPSPINYLSGNAALAQAAQQAIAATTQLQQGRRTSSLKASYDIMTKNPKFTQELVASSAYSSGSGSGLDHTPVPSPITVPQTSTAVRPISARARKKKRKQEAQAQAAAALLHQQSQQHTLADTQILEDSQPGMDWSIDPNEPRYCLCNQVSYGDMVGCDNNDCPIEWFHYGCVGLTHAPKGKWFCPQCTSTMKRRGRR